MPSRRQRIEPAPSQSGLFAEATLTSAEAVAKALHLPTKLISERLRGEKEAKSGVLASLVTPSGAPYLMILLAPAHRFNAAEAELKERMERAATVGVGMLFDPEAGASRYLRRRFDRSEFEYIPSYEHPDGGSFSTDLGWLYRHDPVGKKDRPLHLLNEKVEEVFFEIHSHFRDIDGLHADEALDELCKTLYAKLHDEELTDPGKPYRMQRRAYLSPDECAAEARSLYQDAVAYDSRVFELKIPGYSRSRGVFSTPIRLSNPALAKAVEALQCYHLGKSAFDVKGRAFQKVIGPAMRSGMGQYFTPDPVIRFASEALGPKVTDLILDPFCGSGHFLTACLQLVRQASGKEVKAFHEFAFGKLHGIEKSERMVRVAMTDMRLHGDGHSNIRCADALLAFSNYPDVKPESFDLILTNPPFGSILSSDAVGHLGRFDLAAGKSNVPLEILGLERCVQLLRPGGRMGIVLPDGVLGNRNTKYVREWLAGQGKVRGVVSLPIETFAPFGASIKTCFLLFRKWEPGERRERDYSVFLARVDNVGYDATGRPREGSDLQAVGDCFHDFIRKEGW